MLFFEVKAWLKPEVELGIYVKLAMEVYPEVNATVGSKVEVKAEEDLELEAGV